MRQIIVGVDGSAASRAALAWAVEGARDDDAEIRVVHVWDRPHIGGDALARMLADADDLEAQAWRELDDVVDSVDTTSLARPPARPLARLRPWSAKLVSWLRASH